MRFRSGGGANRFSRNSSNMMFAMKIGGVEPDEVEEGEGTHGIAAAQLHRLVHVRHRAHSLLEGADGVEQIRARGGGSR